MGKATGTKFLQQIHGKKKKKDEGEMVPIKRHIKQI